MNKKIQASQGQVTQQEELVRQLQDKLSSTEGQTVSITMFQAQALEVQHKLETTLQILLPKVGIIHDNFQEIGQSLCQIVLREKEATAARITFQKAVVSSSKEEISATPKNLRMTVEEKIRGDILLKRWEANIAESRRFSKEIKEDCEETFNLLDKKLLGIGKENFSGILG
jgi:hypothetical protein